VITDEEMENAQTESVADILRRVPGLDVVQSSGQTRIGVEAR
jgi:outer membrane receptor for ferrienterochelin and colicin